jgi:hypothetical protein
LKIKESNIKPGDLIQPVHPAQWFPIDYETMDVWRPKDWMLNSCEFHDEDRRPIVYLGMVAKRTGNQHLWIDRVQMGRHMVYYEGSIYFVSPSAWRNIEIVEHQ